MKKTVIFGIVGFVAGAAAGAGITYVMLKHKFEEEYVKYAEDLRDLYDKHMRSIDQAPDITELDGVEEMSDEDKKNFYVKKLEDLGYMPMSEDEYISECNENIEVNPLPDDDEEDEYEDAPEDDGPTEEPIGIEELSYYDYIHTDDTSLSRLSLTYYAGDNTVADTEDEIVPNWRELIGDEFIDKLSKENPTAYYINHSSGLLIDIDYVEGGYKELVEGIATDEEEE